jgi:hypothetical protein
MIHTAPPMHFPSTRPRRFYFTMKFPIIISSHAIWVASGENARGTHEIPRLPRTVASAEFNCDISWQGGVFRYKKVTFNRGFLFHGAHRKYLLSRWQHQFTSSGNGRCETHARYLYPLCCCCCSSLLLLLLFFFFFFFFFSTN